MKMRTLLLCSLIGLGTALSGCAKKKECDALNESIKSVRDDFNKDEKATSAEDFKKMQKTYEDASSKVGGVEISVAELDSLRDKYTELLDDVAKAAKLTSEVVASGGAGDSVDQAKKATDKIEGRSERDIYLDILKFCND